MCKNRTLQYKIGLKSGVSIETASRDENDKVKDIIKRQYQISRESAIDKNGALVRPLGYDINDEIVGAAYIATTHGAAYIAMIVGAVNYDYEIWDRNEFHIGSTSATGGAALAPAPIPSCTLPSIPPFQPLSQPQSTNPFTSAMSWGAPTRDGTSVSRQQTPISQPPPVLFKPQTTFQPMPPQQQYQQPPQQQYQYQEAEERYEDEDEGWVPLAPHQPWNRGRGPPRRAQQDQPLQGQQRYNDHHFYGNPAQTLYFAQPRGQSVALHFQPWEYDDSSPIYIPDDIESQVEIRPQLLGILPEFRGYKQDDPYNHFITTWDQLNAKFLQEFYPASKTMEIRRAIQDFQQKPGEAFHEAWDRLKELMRSCPHHDIPKWQLVKVFFEGASETNQAMINASSSGTIMMQDPEEDWKFLEQLSNGSKANFSTRKTVGTAAAVGADADWKQDNGPQSQSQGGQRGPKTQEANQVYEIEQLSRAIIQPPRQYQPANNNGNANGNGSSNNRGPNNSINNASGTQEDLVAKMYEMFNTTQQQSQANAKAIANMERQIAQMTEDQRKRDNGKLPSTTEVNSTHGQRAGKEHVNTVEAEWRKVTLEDLLESGNEVESEKEEEVNEKVEIEKENRKDTELNEILVEKEPQPKEDKDVQEKKQPIIAGIKQRKKDKKGKKKQEAPKSTGLSMNQPLWDELKNAREDTRILQEMCGKNGKSKTPTPDTLRLTIKASEALLETLPKKEKDPGTTDYCYCRRCELAKTVLQLADQSTKVSRGKLTNVIVKVEDFFYPVDFLVMEYESQEDAPELILGRPFLDTIGAIIDCKTGDLDIFFGSRKRRLNMFESPISLPQGYDDKNLDNNLLMEPAIRDKSKIWTRTGEGGKEEVLKETKEHPLSTIDKEQLLDMMECWRQGTSNTRKMQGKDKQRSFSFWKPSNNGLAGLNRDIGFGIGNSRLPRHAMVLGPRRGAVGKKRTKIAKFCGYFSFVHMSFRLDHQFLQFPEVLDSSVEFASRRDAIIGRWVLEATIIDRDILRDAELWGDIEPFPHHTWTHGDASFTCRGWDRLMANQDDTVYTELLLEFLSTVRFAPGSSEARSDWYDFDWGEPTGCAISESLGGAQASIQRRTSSTAISRSFSRRALRGSPPGLPMQRFGHPCPTYSTRQGHPGRAISGSASPAHDPRPAYAQPGRRRRRPAAPAEPAPQPQLSDVLAAIQDLSQRMSAREAHDQWMAETQMMIMLRIQIDDIPPHPSGGDAGAGPSGTRQDDD
ncbi:hypothetical protein L2E82_45325 [Cichorium intybus]|uniref:Uncharacterized protein n=1 Tax=Cichorium intybus TaxID=13427 RepID=A0ACB8ZSY8_CICIN|nr:hypothetical protein L2E82_45325 [Cichorium intybus]